MTQRSWTQYCSSSEETGNPPSPLGKEGRITIYSFKLGPAALCLSLYETLLCLPLSFTLLVLCFGISLLYLTLLWDTPPDVILNH